MTKPATRKGVGDDKARKPASRRKKKSRGGRPTKFDPSYVEQARKLALLGHTNEEMAGYFGVGLATFERWLSRRDEFRWAVKDGRQKADSEVTQSLYRRAMGYSHQAVKIFADAKTGAVTEVPYTEHYPPETVACIFWLKNRQPGKWREKVEQQITGRDGGPIDVAVAPGLEMLDEYEKRAAAAVERIRAAAKP